METLYENDLALPIDKGLLCPEQENPSGPYFCYPANAQPIGFEGAILYCFCLSMERWFLPATPKAVRTHMYILWRRIFRILFDWF